MKVAIRKPSRKRGRPDPDLVWWIKSVPFVLNPRGHLIHRVRYVSTRIRGQSKKDTPHYWCGNATFSGPVEFLEQPPDGRLLCAVCESKAVQAGEMTAEQLAGRHVHIGVMRPRRLCCQENTN